MVKFPKDALVREGGLEPPRLRAPDPKSGVYANFTTLAVSREERKISFPG